MAVRPRFDPSSEFVAARGFTFAGVPYAAGEPFDKGAASRSRLAMIYEARMINIAPPKTEEEAPADPVTITQTSGGYYDVSAPWLDAPIRARGKVKAETEAQALRDAGEPAEHHGVTLTAGDNGWWDVTANWRPDQTEKVHGEAAARDLATKWRAEGPPADPVTVTPGETDGQFVITAAWLPEPETVEGEEAATERAAAIREAGPPEGWEPPADA